MGCSHSRKQRLTLFWPVQIFRRVGLSAVRLLLVPGIVEALFDGAIAMPIFGMPPTFAFALGFILKAVGPALVIQAMFEVQQKRLGSVKCEHSSAIPPSRCTLWRGCSTPASIPYDGSILHACLDTLTGTVVALPSVVCSGMDKYVSVTGHGYCSGELFPAHAAIPATVVAAASFDDAIAITGYTLFINLAVRQGGNTTWSVMHGPLSLVFGVIAGLISGFICSITKLWDNSFKRTLVMFFSSKSP